MKSLYDKKEIVEKPASNKHDKLVIVLSRNYSTGLSVIRSLGVAGYTVDLIASAYKKGNLDIAACSKYVRNSVEIVNRKTSVDGHSKILERVFKYAGKHKIKPVLFPTDDYTTSIIDSNRTALEKYFILPSVIGGGDGSLTTCMDKTFQADLARRSGLLTPLEWIISLENEIIIPDDMVYPCFCKPIESITGYKKEMAVCETKDSLFEHLKQLQKSKKNRSILVQEYLEIDQEIDLSGVCLDQEIIIPGIVKKTKIAQHEKGVTLAGIVEPFEELGPIQENIINMMKAFHYVGMFDMEFNIVGDKIYFNEVNLRSGGPNFSYYLSGVNLPALFVKYVYGEAFSEDETKIKKYHQHFVYEKVAWEDYLHGFLNKKELKEQLNAADIKLLCNEDDPAPGELFNKKIHLSVHKNRILKVLRKAKYVSKRIKHGVRWRTQKLKQMLLGYPQYKSNNQRKTDSEKPRAIVTGRNYSSNLCMARALGQAGYEVEVLRIFQTKPSVFVKSLLAPDAYSKYVKAYHVCISNRKVKRIVNKLKNLADPERKQLLIPVDDLLADIIDTHYEELKEYYYLPNVNDTAGALSHLMSKDVQKVMAKEAGLPVINSCMIRTENKMFEIPDSVQYPCFVKPNISKNSSKSQMKVCYSRNDLMKTLKKMSSKKDIEVLVEDYVLIRKEYSLLGLSTKSGVVAPGFFGAEKGGHKERRGVALIGKTLPCSLHQEIIDDIIRFVETLHYEGLFDVDLIETVDGEIYFIELNLRFGASGYAITQSGVNLPGMYADYMIFNKPIDLKCSINDTGKLFISERVLFDEYINGYLSKKEVNEYMNVVDIHFIKNSEDMKPYKHFKKFYPLATVKRLYLKIKAK